MPYTIVVYPMVFLVAPIRLWSVSHRHGYVTPADFVRGRFGSSTLALMVAITGIVATMPYIALQLVGIEAVLKAMGVEGQVPIIIAFAILARLHLPVGLRAPALIAFVKDTLIYLVVIVAVIYIPAQARRLGRDLRRRRREVRQHAGRRPTACSCRRPASSATRRSRSARRSRCSSTRTRSPACSPPAAATHQAQHGALPAYSIVLGLLALLGYMAIAAGVDRPSADYRRPARTPTPSCRCCSTRCSRTGSPGVAFAAIAIGALVPAAIMSIAAANLLTRNIYKEYLNKDATPAQEARSARSPRWSSRSAR